MNEIKNVFSYNPDIRKNAYMNWRTHQHEPEHNLHVLAEGYADTAKYLIALILKDNFDKKADSLIYSVLFNIYHSIELYEKCILLLVHGLLSEDYKVPDTHDIKQLYHQMKIAISKKETTMKGFEKYLKVLHDYITELYGFIEVEGEKLGIDFARYPFSTEGKPHFYIKENDNVVIDIENLQKVVDEIFSSLNGLVLKYMDQL